jgi:hypothetical protein
VEAVLQRYPRASTPRPEPRIVEIGDGLSEPIRRVGMRHVRPARIFRSFIQIGRNYLALSHTSSVIIMKYFSPKYAEPVPRRER